MESIDDVRINSMLIGDRVKSVREKNGLTADQLAKLTGLSKTLIFQIEKDLISPPIATLLRIANAMQTNISNFFQDEQKDVKVSVVRKDEYLLSKRRQAGSNIKIGYNYETLAHKKLYKHMEPFIVTFDIKTKEEVVRFSHNGEEFIYVLEGVLEFTTEDNTVILNEGDSLYFESNQLHGFRALGKTKAKAVVVVYMAQ